MTNETMHIGFDDTDSPNKGCTTYIAALLIEKLEKLKVKFIDYPNLVRLNPNVPWKTRGNGALCLRIRFDEDHREEIKEIVISTVDEHADLHYKRTNPGIVFFQGDTIPEEVKDFSRDAITGIVEFDHALKLLKKSQAEAAGFKKGRGIIGGLAAIGEDLTGDHTFEILAYRSPENWGTKRRIEEGSIFEMDEQTNPNTFNNIDHEVGRVLITPGGPDPVLLGIRGESAEIVKEAYTIIQAFEPVERWVIFRTNQGTDSHLKKVYKLKDIEPCKPVIATGIVATNPRIIPRRHIIFSIEDESGKVDCAAYEPTGFLRIAARKLILGDQIEVYGGVRAPSKNLPTTINLEKIKVLTVIPKMVYHNPPCPKCGKKLKSMGHNKGFRCEKCGSRHIELNKVEVKVKREIAEGLYITSCRSQRHLTKPIRRYGMEKCYGSIGRLIENWHSP